MYVDRQNLLFQYNVFSTITYFCLNIHKWGFIEV